jgi:hypothetical protein
MAEPLREKFVIEEAFIHKMLKNPQYLAAFPFLRQYAAQVKKMELACGSCGNRKARTKSIDYTAIKQTLASMPPDKQAKLLQLAKAKSVRMLYRNQRNEVIKLTIRGA